MFTRRDFIKVLAAAGAVVLNPLRRIVDFKIEFTCNT
jgi:hypothetical protein